LSTVVYVIVFLQPEFHLKLKDALKPLLSNQQIELLISGCKKRHKWSAEEMNSAFDLRSVCEGLQIHENKTQVSFAIVIHTDKMVQQSSL
jgi:hypothetical protein